MQMLPMIKIIDYLLWHGNQQKWVSTPSKWVSTLPKWVSTPPTWVSTPPKWVSTPPKMGVNTSKMGLNRRRRCSHGVLTDCSCTKRVAQQSRFPSQIRVISVISFSQLTLREENGTLNKALRGRIWPKTKLASMFVRQTLRWKGSTLWKVTVTGEVGTECLASRGPHKREPQQV